MRLMRTVRQTYIAKAKHTRKGEAYRDDGTLPRPNPITRYAETLTLARAIQQ
jgi:hypothetical protein